MAQTRAEWEQYVGELVLPTAMWIDGGWREGTGDSVHDVISPRNGSAVTQVPLAGDDDVDLAVAGARAAFEHGDWSRISARERGKVLQRWADLIHDNRDELAALVALEMGKPVLDARDIELKTTEQTYRWYGELADKQLDESPRGLADAVALVTREPVGVVAAITPWNFPMTLSSWKIAAALVVGNSVVVKPAIQSPLSLLRVAELGTAAGLPAGVLQVLTGTGGQAGSRLARHEGVNCLTFTGSPGVGKQLMHYSGDSNAKPVHLELGGKSPHIVFADADLDAAAESVAWAITFNAGQMCTAGARLIVDKRIEKQFVSNVIERIAAKKVGDPFAPETVIGPLSSAKHRKDVAAHVRRGVQEGATLELGSPDIADGDGFYFDPVVFTGVAPKQALFQEEIFGPVLSVTSFDGADEAVALANDSQYALGSGVWTTNLRTAHDVSRRIDAGIVWVNCFEEGDLTVPFGGRKLSGHGADKSEHGLEKFTSLKTTWIQL